MSRTAPQMLGRTGERLALEHYERLGFTLLERNLRSRAGELDLIVADRKTIVFVEVKTRRSGGLDPLLAITPAKIHRLRSLAAIWLAAHPQRHPELRFDAVAVQIDASGKLVALEQVEAIV